VRELKIEKYLYVYSHTTQKVMNMPNMTLAISSELHNFVKKHNEINWSEIARRAMTTQAKRIQIMEKLVANSDFTERDVEELDEKIKAGLLKRFSK